MNALASLLGLPITHARIESVHFESLTERTLALSARTPVSGGRVYLGLVRDGRVVGRWFPVAAPRADRRYREDTRRNRGLVYVTVPITKGDWLTDELALRSRKGDRVLCSLPATNTSRWGNASLWPSDGQPG